MSSDDMKDLALAIVCESPIETKMVVALRKLQPRFGMMRLYKDYDAYEQATATTPVLLFGIIPQAKIGKYRADILLACEAPWGVATVVVECDGFEFHAAEDEQVIADKLRDRAMHDMGHRVRRFTGSEITREANLCAKEAYNCLLEARKHRL